MAKSAITARGLVSPDVILDRPGQKTPCCLSVSNEVVIVDVC